MSSQYGKAIEPLHMGFLVESGRNICGNKTGWVIAVAKDDELARRIIACVNACAGIPDQILTAVGAFGGFGRDHMVNHVTKQRDDLLSALEDIAKITYDAGFNIGGPLEHCPGNLPKDEAKRLLSLACEYLEETSKAAGRAIAMVKGNHSGDATNMVDDTSAKAQPCAHAREVELRTGDGTPVMYCPDCGRNEAQPVRFSSDDTSAPAIVFYPAGSLGEAVESEGGEA